MTPPVLWGPALPVASWAELEDFAVATAHREHLPAWPADRLVFHGAIATRCSCGVRVDPESTFTGGWHDRHRADAAYAIIGRRVLQIERARAVSCPPAMVLPTGVPVAVCCETSLPRTAGRNDLARCPGCRAWWRAAMVDGGTVTAWVRVDPLVAVWRRVRLAWTKAVRRV